MVFCQLKELGHILTVSDDAFRARKKDNFDKNLGREINCAQSCDQFAKVDDVRRTSLPLRSQLVVVFGRRDEEICQWRDKGEGRVEIPRIPCSENRSEVEIGLNFKLRKSWLPRVITFSNFQSLNELSGWLSRLMMTFICLSDRELGAF